MSLYYNGLFEYHVWTFLFRWLTDETYRGHAWSPAACMKLKTTLFVSSLSSCISSMGLISCNDFTWSSELQKVCDATTVSKDSTCREGSAHPRPFPLIWLVNRFQEKSFMTVGIMPLPSSFKHMHTRITLTTTPMNPNDRLLYINESYRIISLVYFQINNIKSSLFPWPA